MQGAKSLAWQALYSGDPETNAFLASKYCWILVLALFCLPFAISKELKELKVASVLLFIGVTAFILIFTF